MEAASLRDLKPGEKGTVHHILSSSPSVRRRLLEMGLTVGTTVEVMRFAPMGDPIEISVRGYRLSLRREEAASVHVNRIPS